MASRLRPLILLVIVITVSAIPVCAGTNSTIFAGNATYTTNGVPCLAVAPTGYLVAVWYAAGPDPDLKLLIAFSTDLGATWGAPTVLQDTPGQSDWDPKLFAPDSTRVGSRLFLYYDSGGILYSRLSTDSGATWGAPAPVVTGHAGSQASQKPIVLANGNWLLPYSWSDGTRHPGVLISSDQGTTWTSHDIPTPVECTQPVIAQLANGHLLCYLRTHEGVSYRSVSTDSGVTWTTAVASDFPNPWSHHELLKLRDGRLVYIYDDSATDRYPLQAAFSANDGASWDTTVVVDGATTEVAFPSAVEIAQTLIVAYHYGNKQQIREYRMDLTEVYSSALMPDSGRPSHHGSTVLELPNGDLLAAWYAGTAEGATDVAVIGSRRPSGSGAWTTPTVWADTPGYTEGNPVLFRHPGGSVQLFYVTAYAPSVRPSGYGIWSYTVLERTDSADGGLTWGAPMVLKGTPSAPPDGQPPYPDQGWFGRNKLVRLDNGDLLLPLYNENDWTSRIWYSTDNGSSWAESLIDCGLGYRNGNIQPTIIQRRNLSLLCYMRTGNFTNPDARLWRSTSADRGRTWTAPDHVDINNPNSAADMVRLRNGHLALVYNSLADSRRILSLSVSTDEGATWPYTRDLENAPSGEFSYPAIIEGADGTMHITYTYLRQNIKYVNLNEAWVRQVRDSFDDIAPGTFSLPYVEAMRRMGITAGCSTDPPLYCPASNVTRGQMAIFILRAMGETPCATYHGYFADVPSSHPWWSWIERMYELGITSGCGVIGWNRYYCPEQVVTRGQMAVFLVRAVDGGDPPSAPPIATFVDVPTSHPFFKWIERFSQLGVTSGCGVVGSDRYYCPNGGVRRDQMAIFLVHAFQVPL